MGVWETVKCVGGKRRVAGGQVGEAWGPLPGARPCARGGRSEAGKEADGEEGKGEIQA